MADVILFFEEIFMNLMFFVNSILLGAGLAMDAFSVSLANGLNEPNMKKGRMIEIAGIFAGFQFAMPMIGWVCVHTIMNLFHSFEKFIPWIALILLVGIGGNMLKEGFSKEEENLAEEKITSKGKLLIQGIATSIDALSVGFTISSYGLINATVSSLIIGIVTFTICMAGLFLGKKFGMKLADKATILGGFILIAIGIEIFVTGMM